jgi:O-antigen ligase
MAAEAWRTRRQIAPLRRNSLPRFAGPAAVVVVAALMGYWLQVPGISTATKLGVAALPALLLLVLMRRELAGIFLLVSLPFTAVSVEGGAGIFTWTGIFIFGGWLIGVLAFESWGTLKLRRTDLSVAAYTGLAAISALFAGGNGQLARAYLTAFAIYFLISRTIKSTRQVEWSIVTLCASLGGAAIIALAVPGAAGIRESAGGVVRVGAIGTAGAQFTGIDRFGGELVVAIVLSWLAFRGTDLKAVAARMLSAFAVLALVQTVSRSAAVAMMVAILAWAVTAPAGRRLPRVGFAIVIIGFAILAAPAPLKDRFAAVEQLQQESLSRLAIWQGGLRMFEAHPVLGVGIGNYPEQLPRYLHGLPLSEVNQDAHSVFLATLGQLGAVGFAALLYLLWRVSREAGDLTTIGRRLHPHESIASITSPSRDLARMGGALFAAFAALLVMAAMLDLTRDPFLYGMLGLVHGTHRLLEGSR